MNIMTRKWSWLKRSATSCVEYSKGKLHMLTLIHMRYVCGLCVAVFYLCYTNLFKLWPFDWFSWDQPYVDWFKWDDSIHPLSSAPEPKRRFIPSKWEAKKVLKLVRAIRKGLIKFDKPEEEPNVYLLWGDDSTSDQKSKHLTYIPPPKLKLPGENFLLTFCCFSASLGNSIFKVLFCTIWLSRTRWIIQSFFGIYSNRGGESLIWIDVWGRSSKIHS